MDVIEIARLFKEALTSDELLEEASGDDVRALLRSISSGLRALLRRLPHGVPDRLEVSRTFHSRTFHTN